MFTANPFKRFSRYLSRGPSRRRPQRLQLRPQLDRLEDRLVPSAAGQTGSALVVNASAGTPLHVRSILFHVDQADHTKIDVEDGGTRLGQFNIASVKTIVVVAHGFDAIDADDSAGYPFNPGTSMAIVGGGLNNSLDLLGDQPIVGNETYTAGTATAFASLDQVDGTRFLFNSTISTVVDELPTTSGLNVVPQGQAVILSNRLGLGVLSGLAAPGGGGSTFTFANKPFLQLQEHTNNATITLGAAAASPGLKAVNVHVFGVNDRVTINATPSSVFTDVSTFGSIDVVNLRGNSGVVAIAGNKQDTVFLGSNDLAFSKSVTSGIDANVFVSNSFDLQILDGGNTTTKESVGVTESAIFSSGLFGSNAVQVSYSATPVEIFTGQLAETYVVTGFHPGARFTNPIFIHDFFSSAGLNVTVDVDAGSGLLLNLSNLNPKAGSLSINAPGAQFHPGTPLLPDGSETATFAGGLTSEVDYFGFETVHLAS